MSLMDWSIILMSMLIGDNSTNAVQFAFLNLGRTTLFQILNYLSYHFSIFLIFFFNSVYSKIENMQEDELYFFMKSNLLSRVSVDHRINTYSGKIDESEKVWVQRFIIRRGRCQYIFLYLTSMTSNFMNYCSGFGRKLTKIWLRSWISHGVTNMILICLITISGIIFQILNCS